MVLGSPGCGKTTRLLDRVDEALDNGLKPEKIAYLSFTKKAANEAISRACLKFDLDKKRFTYFRTLHSLAYRDLKISKEELMSDYHIQQFAEKNGIKLKNTKSYSNEISYSGSDIGDKWYKVYSISRAQMRPLKEIWQEMHDYFLPFESVELLTENYEKYKEEFDLMDFADFLDQSKTVLPVELFILDEAQDLTAQQWMYAKQVAGNAKEVMIAGDDDQAIFQWAGADLDYFLKIKAEVEVLPISYRLPKTIYDFANRIIEPVKKRYKKKWKPTDKEGSVSWIYDRSTVILDGEWMLLAREGYQLYKLEKMAREQGVIYKFRNKWSNEESYVKAIVQYLRLNEGESLAKKDRDLINNFSSKKEITGEWWDYMDLLSIEQREYVKAIIRNGHSLINPGKVKISTIHGSKGGEADNVLLITEVSKRISNAYRENPDPERRVWYVGVSRAKHRLYLTLDKSFLRTII